MELSYFQYCKIVPSNQTKFLALQVMSVITCIGQTGVCLGRKAEKKGF